MKYVMIIMVVLLSGCVVGQTLHVGAGVHSWATNADARIFVGVNSGKTDFNIGASLLKYDGNAWVAPSHPIDGHNIVLFGSYNFHPDIAATIGYNTPDIYMVGFSFSQRFITTRLLYETNGNMTKNYIGLSIEFYYKII